MVYTDGVHLIADTIDELHEFARMMGLKKEWFQARPCASFPHYDLTTRRALARAVGYGAQHKGMSEFVMELRRIRDRLKQGGDW